VATPHQAPIEPEAIGALEVNRILGGLHDHRQARWRWPNGRGEPQALTDLHRDMAGSGAWRTTVAGSSRIESRSTMSSEPGRERGQYCVRVIPSPVEPPVH